MADSRLAFDIIARGGSSAAAEFEKVARGADKAGDAMKKNSKISDQVAKATMALAKAHNAETTALDKVQVAEQKLSEVRANGNAKTSQVLTAEKALAKARRDAAVAGNVAQKAAKDLGRALDDEGKKAGRGILASVSKYLGGDGEKIFKQLGENAGNGILGGITGALRTPVIGPALAAGLGSAVAVAAPAVGSIAAAGIVAGFGTGLGALGIVFASKSKTVQATWSKTLHSMGSDMSILSRPFESTLINMAGTAKRTFATFAPELGLAFKTLAPAFTRFGDDVGRAFERLAPAMVPLSQAASNVLKSLGGALPDIVGNLSGKLIELSNSVEKNPQGLKDLAQGIGGLADGAIKTITVLNDLDRAMGKLPGSLKGISGIASKLSPVKSGFDALFTVVGKIDDAFGGAGKKAADLGTSVKLSADTAKLWTQGLSAAQIAAMGVGTTVGSLSQRTRLQAAATAALTAKFNAQMATTNALTDSLNRVSSALLAGANSQVDYAQAVADATAAVKQNGHTHDLATQKGRDNQRALLQVAAAANAQRDAMLKSNAGTAAAARASEGARANFVKLAQQMGYTKPQAEAMAKSMIAIPNVTRTAKLQANIADLTSKLATAKGKLADKNLTATKRAKLEAYIKQLEAGIATAKAALNGVPNSKTVTITTNVVTKYTTIGSRSSGSGVGGGHETGIPGRASGGPVKAGQTYLVGENGPELLITERSGFVVNSRGTRQLRTALNHGFSSAGEAGTAQDIAGQTAQIQAMIKNLTGGDRKLANALAAGSKKLMTLANLRGQAAAQLQAAQAKLATAVQVKADFRKSITDASLAFNSITNVQADDNGNITSSAIINQMSETLRKTQNFAANLAKLKAKGLNATLYQQLAEAGAGQGGDIAAALLGGGQSAIAAANSLQAQINTASNNLGLTASKNLYQAGVDSAQGLVNGLLAKTKALDAASAKLAGQIVARIKHDLGIHSPSRVLAWHGRMATQGFASGIVSQLPTVARAAGQLADTALPSTPVRRYGVGAGSGGRPVVNNFNISVSGALDATDAGKKIITAIRREVRISGGNVQTVLGPGF